MKTLSSRSRRSDVSRLTALNIGPCSGISSIVSYGSERQFKTTSTFRSEILTASRMSRRVCSVWTLKSPRCLESPVSCGFNFSFLYFSELHSMLTDTLLHYFSSERILTDDFSFNESRVASSLVELARHQQNPARAHLHDSLVRVNIAILRSLASMSSKGKLQGSFIPPSSPPLTSFFRAALEMFPRGISDKFARIQSMLDSFSATLLAKEAHLREGNKTRWRDQLNAMHASLLYLEFLLARTSHRYGFVRIQARDPIEGEIFLRNAQARFVSAIATFESLMRRVSFILTFTLHQLPII